MQKILPTDKHYVKGTVSQEMNDTCRTQLSCLYCHHPLAYSSYHQGQEWLLKRSAALKVYSGAALRSCITDRFPPRLQMVPEGLSYWTPMVIIIR